MAQYDGAIRIVTKITTKDAKESLYSLEYTIKKSAKEIDSLRAKMDALKNQKISTKEWKDLEKELSEAEKELSELIKTRDEWANLGVNSGLAWEDINNKIKAASSSVDLIKEKMQSLTNAGKDFTLGKDTAEYKSYEKQIGYEEKAIAEAGRHYKSLVRTKDGYEKLKKTATSALQGIGSVAKKATIAPFKLLGNTAKNAFLNIGKASKKSEGMLSTFGSRFKSLALSLLIFNQISKAFNAMVSGMREGFSNLSNENASFRNQVNGLKASLLTLKNAFAGAFAPIVQIAIPYIQQLIGWLTSAISAVGQFIAALTGRKTYTKAIQQTAGAFEDAAGAANDAKEAVEGYLNPLDEINKHNDGKDKGVGAGGGGGAGGAGQMFEEVPVDDNISNMAKKFKEIMSQLFAPLKESWNREGEFVMDSWKFALQETWKLIKDIGRDFLIMWNEESTIQMFSDLLHIVGDIGLVAGNLAERFREAWNTNDVGLHILENIRDIFAIIIGHIRSAADYTVEWSKKLDFYPLLESINGLLEALKPLTDNIGAGLEWFYKNVLLPIAGWTIQEAVPAFLDMLSAAIGVVNAAIEALQPLAIWLWESFLQPLGQWAGETIIAAMETITGLLQKFGDWISEHQGIVENFVIIIGSFFAAWKIANFASDIGVLIGGLVSFISTGGLATVAANLLGGAIAFLTSPIGIATAAIGAIIAIGVLLYKNWDEISAKAKEVWDFVKQKFQDFDTWLQSVFTHDWTKEFGIIGEVFNAFFKNVSSIWNSIKKIFNGIITFIKGVFTGNWRQAWEGIKQILKGVWGGMVSIIKSPINGIISLINGMVRGIVSGLNSAIRAFNRIRIPSWVPGIGGKGINISTISTPRIPYLAQGTVVPPNREFMAVLGDNKREPEVVSPLSTMKQAFMEAMTEMGGMGGSRSETIIIRQYLDGKQITQAVIKEGKIQQMSTGSNPFMLGTT